MDAYHVTSEPPSVYTAAKGQRVRSRGPFEREGARGSSALYDVVSLALAEVVWLRTERDEMKMATTSSRGRRLDRAGQDAARKLHIWSRAERKGLRRATVTRLDMTARRVARMDELRARARRELI